MILRFRRSAWIPWCTYSREWPSASSTSMVPRERSRSTTRCAFCPWTLSTRRRTSSSGSGSSPWRACCSACWCTAPWSCRCPRWGPTCWSWGTAASSRGTWRRRCRARPTSATGGCCTCLAGTLTQTFTERSSANWPRKLRRQLVTQLNLEARPTRTHPAWGVQRYFDKSLRGADQNVFLGNRYDNDAIFYIFAKISDWNYTLPILYETSAQVWEAVWDQNIMLYLYWYLCDTRTRFQVHSIRLYF